jgi:hypothetical protein
MFVKMQDASMCVPLCVVNDALPGGSSERRLQKPMFGFRSPGGSLDIPAGPGVTGFLVFIKASDENSDWRYFEVDKKALSKTNVELGPINDILDLPMVKDLKQSNELWEKYEAAQKQFQSYKGPKVWP